MGCDFEFGTCDADDQDRSLTTILAGTLVSFAGRDPAGGDSLGTPWLSVTRVSSPAYTAIEDRRGSVVSAPNGPSRYPARAGRGVRGPRPPALHRGVGRSPGTSHQGVRVDWEDPLSSEPRCVHPGTVSGRAATRSSVSGGPGVSGPRQVV